MGIDGKGKFCAKSAAGAPPSPGHVHAGIEKTEMVRSPRAKAEAELIFQPRKGRILIRGRRSWLSAARRKMRRFIANMNDLSVFGSKIACTLNSDLAKKRYREGPAAAEIIMSQVALVRPTTYTSTGLFALSAGGKVHKAHFSLNSKKYNFARKMKRKRSDGTKMVHVEMRLLRLLPFFSCHSPFSIEHTKCKVCAVTSG